jgi:hypothetical protein
VAEKASPCRQKLSEELLGQFGNKTPIIDVAWRQAEGQHLALIIDDQAQLESVEPADRNLAAGSAPGTHLMLVEASTLANRKRRRVDEADPGAATQLGMQRGHPWDQNRGHQLNKALRAHQTGNALCR